jgi:hypothetical protein
MVSLQEGCTDSAHSLESLSRIKWKTFVGIWWSIPVCDYTLPLSRLWLGSHHLVNETLQTQWQRDRKLGPGGDGWDEGEVIPNEIRRRLSDASLTPLIVKLGRGDAIICHYLLVHEVAANYGDEIRMQLYLRVKAKEFDNVDSLVEMWRDYRLAL